MFEITEKNATCKVGNKTYKIPERMWGGIERYVNDHIQPGGFLSSLICNDLLKVFLLGDSENLANLMAFIHLFYFEVPSICWGSHEKMFRWLNRTDE